MSQAHDVTVVVCTRNRTAELRRCLASIAALSPAAREVIVVNSAGDAVAEGIAREFGAVYAYTPKAGVSHARNVGAATATSALVAYLDDDAVALPDWIEKLAKVFTNPITMAASGAVLPMDSDQPSGDAYFAIAFNSQRLRSADRDTPGWFWLANTGRIGVGANLMLRREIFQTWRGFDERLGRGAPIEGAEEHLAFFEIIKMGFRCEHVPDARVRHPALSSDEQFRKFALQMIEIGAGYFTLLFVEHPLYRMEMLRGITARIFGSKITKNGRSWGGSKVGVGAKLGAYVRGVRNYLRTRSGPVK